MRLVIYFSRKGENLVCGKVKQLKFGNTAHVGQIIGQFLNAKTVEITPIEMYPNDYTKCLKVSKEEWIKQKRPSYSIEDIDLAEYNEIIIGYPNWWGSYPMIISRFLEEQDLSGKRIFPFCTHEGSGFGTSILDLKKACPLSIIKQGLAIYGSKINCSNTAIENWLSTIEHE